MKPTVVTAETPLLARKDGAAPAKTRRLAHIFIACALAIAAIVGALYVHGGAPLPFARSASGSDVDVARDDHQRLGDERVGATMNGSQFGFDDDAARPSTPLSSVPADEEITADVASAPRFPVEDARLGARSPPVDSSAEIPRPPLDAREALAVEDDSGLEDVLENVSGGKPRVVGGSDEVVRELPREETRAGAPKSGAKSTTSSNAADDGDDDDDADDDVKQKEGQNRSGRRGDMDPNARLSASRVFHDGFPEFRV